MANISIIGAESGEVKRAGNRNFEGHTLALNKSLGTLFHTQNVKRLKPLR
jgi:hypothetical protein